MTGKAMTDHPMQPPRWADQAVATVSTYLRNGWNIKAIHLTDAQREDLKDYTGQTSTLFGYPVR